MIDLYTWGTPNGRKVSIMLEELGLAYTTHEVNIGKGEQRDPAFIAMCPNSKIPVIVDSDGPGGEPLTLFETGAILMYLAEKTSSDLLPSDPVKRALCLQWLFFQHGGVGPMFGQAHHFMFNPSEVVPYGQERYHKETKRLYGVMDQHFAASTYFVGDDYTIADIATYPWVARHPRHEVDLEDFPNVKRWFDHMSARPAVEKGMAVPFIN